MHFRFQMHSLPLKLFQLVNLRKNRLRRSFGLKLTLDIQTTENHCRSDLQIDLMSKLERGYFVMNLDEIFLMRESALEPMMQQNAIIEPLSILLKISLKLQPNQNPSLFRYWNSAKIIIDSVN